MSRFIPALLMIVSLSGCSTLFPEFFGGSPADAGTTDGGDAGNGVPQISGVACIVADVRDYRTCAVGSPGILRITVEETRDEVMSDVTGHYTLPLSSAITSATVAAIDPTGHYAPSIIPLRSASGVYYAALPLVEAQTLQNLALANGQILDPANGSVLAWATDTTGTPVASVTFPTANALVDGANANELDTGNRTNTHGTIALLQAAPTTLTLALTPPPTLPLAGDSFVLPVRAGALTVSTLVLPPL